MLFEELEIIIILGVMSDLCVSYELKIVYLIVLCFGLIGWEWEIWVNVLFVCMWWFVKLFLLIY